MILFLRLLKYCYRKYILYNKYAFLLKRGHPRLVVSINVEDGDFLFKYKRKFNIFDIIRIPKCEEYIFMAYTGCNNSC